MFCPYFLVVYKTLECTEFSFSTREKWFCTDFLSMEMLPKFQVKPVCPISRIAEEGDFDILTIFLSSRIRLKPANESAVGEDETTVEHD